MKIHYDITRGTLFLAEIQQRYPKRWDLEGGWVGRLRPAQPSPIPRSAAGGARPAGYLWP